MRFAFDEEQLAFRDAVRGALTKEWSSADVRAAWDADPGNLDRRIWTTLDDMGVLSMLAPEESGGLGLDYCSLVCVLEETGRVALPHPVVDTAAVAGPLGITGTMIAAPLDTNLVCCGQDADAVLVRQGDELRLFDRDNAEFEPVEGIDHGRRLARLVGTRGSGDVVTSDDAQIDAAYDRGALGTAAQLVGLAQTMLDMTVAYAKERHQFGAPIGSFQAVKHHLTDAHKELAFARPAVYRAAWSVAGGDAAADRHVSMAKAMASDAARLVGRKALQCHGAIGYTVEHDLHLYLKRVWALSTAWGGPRRHRDRVAKSLGL